MAIQPTPGQEAPNAPPWPTETVHCSACNKHLNDSGANVLGWSENGRPVIVCDEACQVRWRREHP